MSSYYQPGKCSPVSVLSPDSSEEPPESVITAISGRTLLIVTSLIVLSDKLPTEEDVLEDWDSE